MNKNNKVFILAWVLLLSATVLQLISNTWTSSILFLIFMIPFGTLSFLSLGMNFKYNIVFKLSTLYVTVVEIVTFIDLYNYIGKDTFDNLFIASIHAYGIGVAIGSTIDLRFYKDKLNKDKARLKYISDSINYNLDCAINNANNILDTLNKKEVKNK